MPRGFPTPRPQITESLFCRALRRQTSAFVRLRCRSDLLIENRRPERADLRRLPTLRSIMALQDLGHNLRMPLSESLDDGILELRAKVGSDITRVLYFFIVGDRAVLTHGFVKKTQKTPTREIKRAKEIRIDYLHRCMD